MENAVIAGYPIVLPAHRAQFHREHPDWHKGWLDSIHTHLKPDDVVIDVGAEQGDLSALVASWIPDGGIVLVEPQPLFWPTIRETFSANGLKPIETFMGFATDVSNYLAEPTSGWPPVEFIDQPVPEPGFYHLNEHGAPTVRLDQGMGFVMFTAAMIDVEGAELLVLKGLQDYLSGDRIPVWCAIHPEIMRDRYSHDPNDLMAYMKDLGYQAELLGFQGEIHARFWQ